MEFLSQLVMQYLTQGFCYFDDGLYHSPGTPYPYKISLMLTSWNTGETAARVGFAGRRPEASDGFW